MSMRTQSALDRLYVILALAWLSLAATALGRLSTQDVFGADDRSEPWWPVSPEQRDVVKRSGRPLVVAGDVAGMRFVLVPPGTFTMGSQKDGLHRVTIKHEFYMSETEVSVAQYRAFKPAHENGHVGFGISLSDDHRPVGKVSWRDATAFADFLSQRAKAAGKRRVYRLPTEAEWEYACRAGTTGTTYWEGGTPPFDVEDTALARQRLLRCAPVESGRPNPWGIRGMGGNALEWCSDWFGLYKPGELTDPLGPKSGTERVVRGGGLACESHLRLSRAPEAREVGLGIRLILIESRPW